MSNFWDLVWLLISTFILVGYLLVLFHIVVDVLRDAELGGGGKALWILALLFLPFLTALIYLVARGKGMGQRQLDALRRADPTPHAAAGKSPVEQIAHAKQLLDAQAITADEYARLKAKALG